MAKQACSCEISWFVLLQPCLPSAKPQYKLIRDLLFGESYDKFADKGIA